MWLKDFLPEQIPFARILLFGYNANVVFNSGQSGLREHADDLLDRLRRKRIGKHKVFPFGTWYLTGCFLTASPEVRRQTDSIYRTQPRGVTNQTGN